MTGSVQSMNTSVKFTCVCVCVCVCVCIVQPMGNGVKISWKGSDDPWMQVETYIERARERSKREERVCVERE